MLDNTLKRIIQLKQYKEFKNHILVKLSDGEIFELNENNILEKSNKKISPK